MRMCLTKRDVVLSVVATKGLVVDLTLEIGEESAGADAEEMRMRPLFSEFLHHHDEPVYRVLRCPDASCGLEADLHPCLR